MRRAKEVSNIHSLLRFSLNENRKGRGDSEREVKGKPMLLKCELSPGVRTFAIAA